MKDACDITVILDRSGSMESCREATIAGINSFVEEQKAVPGECTLTLAQFDHEYEIVLENCPIKDVPERTAANYVPRGTTALLDAIGRTINSTGARLALLDEGERPNKVLLVIVTDGMENASVEFTKSRIVTMIEDQKTNYDWKFVFLGADLAGIDMAREIGTHVAIPYTPTDKGTRSMYTGMSVGTTQLRTSGVLCTNAFAPQNVSDEKAANESNPVCTAGP